MARQGREFAAETGLSLYPFSDSASLLARSGVTIDPAALLDATIYPVGGGARQSITRITVGSRGAVEIAIGDERTPAQCLGQFGLGTVPSELLLLDPRGLPAGLLVLDPSVVTSWRAWSVGDHIFPAGTAEFVASCVIPTPEPGVRGLADATGQIVSGHGWIVGESGVVVRPDPENPTHAIRVDVVGDPLSVRRLCDPAGVGRLDVRFLRTINGLPPDASGNFFLTVNGLADSILRIVPQPPDTLLISVAGKLLRS